jgi:hypothetical protein
MYRIIILLFAVFALTGCGTIIQESHYSCRESVVFGKSIAIFADNRKIAEIVPSMHNRIAEAFKIEDKPTRIKPLYSSLADRADFSQPKPFDDINGDGRADFVCIEYQEISNNGSYPAAIRFFSIDGNRITETKSLFIEIGEALHFDDFNNDAVLELVNTDNERHFLYSKKGYPISAYVWIFDTHYKEWWNAAEMIEE